MRPWLVVVGVVFLTLSGGTLATLYFGGDGSPTTVVTPYAQFNLGANTTENLPLYGPNSSTGQFSLVWQANSPIVVTLEEAQPCPGQCAEVLYEWSSNLSGKWEGTGSFKYPLQCVLDNAGSRSATVTMTGRAVGTNPTHFPLEVDLVLGAGAAGLLLVGGLAIFLGLFLRGDPYRERPSTVSPSAEDLDETVREESPDH